MSSKYLLTFGLWKSRTQKVQNTYTKITLWTQKMMKWSLGRCPLFKPRWCFRFHVTLPETNSKSTWKWMVGRRSGFLLGENVYFQGQTCCLFQGPWVWFHEKNSWKNGFPMDCTRHICTRLSSIASFWGLVFWVGFLGVQSYLRKQVALDVLG